jgi:DNA mismatch endonuclease (patch repair protein)
MDRLSRDRRSQNMAAIRGRNTVPELVVRKILHSLGYRFRLHKAGLPGRPDIVLAKYSAAIFVHGCFWHRHDDPHCDARPPKSNQDYWLPKLERTVQRDAQHRHQLSEMGWRVLVLWECELGDANELAGRLRHFVEGTDGHSAPSPIQAQGRKRPRPRNAFLATQRS